MADSGGTRERRLVGAPPAGGTSHPPNAAPEPHLRGSEQAALQALPGADQVVGAGLTQAMERLAAREAWTDTVKDRQARRWRALCLDARQAGQTAPTVAALLQA